MIFSRAILCIAILTVACLGLIAASGTMRAAAYLVTARLFAVVRAPDFALIGDSRVLDCRWIGRLTYKPYALANLAVGGTVTRQIVSQAAEANALGARVVLIAAGINDVLLDQASAEKIEADYALLLRTVGATQRGVVTLVAYTSNPTHTAPIDRLNDRIRRLAGQSGFPVIDLNPVIATNGVLVPHMTRDGVHFTNAVCSVWLTMFTKADAEVTPSRRPQ